jgi:hypothetical protein
MTFDGLAAWRTWLTLNCTSLLAIYGVVDTRLLIIFLFRTDSGGVSLKYTVDSGCLLPSCKRRFNNPGVRTHKTFLISRERLLIAVRKHGK